MPLKPSLCIVGNLEHADFREAAELLRRDGRIVTDDAAPELIVIAQVTPGQFAEHKIRALQRQWPLAGMIGLLGTWCEGEPRTGRPWPGVQRLYWYEFPAWWHRQLVLRAAGRCPDWARPCDGIERNLPNVDCAGHGLIIVSTPVRETFEVLADVLHQAGYASLWRHTGRPLPFVHGAVAGVWDGGQLDDLETVDFADFCRECARHQAPVIAILDFPRRDRVDLARDLGAAAVLGKPWLNADLAATIHRLTGVRAVFRAA